MKNCELKLKRYSFCHLCKSTHKENCYLIINKDETYLNTINFAQIQICLDCMKKISNLKDKAESMLIFS